MGRPALSRRSAHEVLPYTRAKPVIRSHHVKAAPTRLREDGHPLTAHAMPVGPISGQHQSMAPFRFIVAFYHVAAMQSVARAAQELSVTPGAVSQQLRVLEEQLGTKLVTRAGRRIRLTEAGERYFEMIASDIENIIAATRQIQGERTTMLLTVRATPTVSTKWLLPRLSAVSRSQSCDRPSPRRIKRADRLQPGPRRPRDPARDWSLAGLARRSPGRGDVPAGLLPCRGGNGRA